MIKRELYLKKIRPFIGNDLVKVLTGIRRSGKSVMLDLIKEELIQNSIDRECIISINFENMSNAFLNNAEVLHRYITDRVNEINRKSNRKIYLFFDEIQEVKDWEKCINSFRLEFDCDIYITGSNAKLLSGELATYLAGRYVEFTIYPFSFEEFCLLYKSYYNDASTKNCFSKFIVLGGMPSLGSIHFDETASFSYLNDIFNSIELKDVIKRNSIKDAYLLERIILYIISNTGSVFSSSSLSKFFKSEGRAVSKEKILNYLKACTDAFLFYRIKRQDLQGKKILTINEKYYIADHGIREAIFGDNKKNINLILENIVCLEILRREYNCTVGKINGQEIDFVCQKQGNIVYIQVSYLLASEETIHREFDVFYKIPDNFPKYVVSLDEIDISRDGIKHMNIIDFLLTKEW